MHALQQFFRNQAIQQATKSVELLAPVSGATTADNRAGAGCHLLLGRCWDLLGDNAAQSDLSFAYKCWEKSLKSYKERGKCAEAADAGIGAHTHGFHTTCPHPFDAIHGKKILWFILGMGQLRAGVLHFKLGKLQTSTNVLLEALEAFEKGRKGHLMEQCLAHRHLSVVFRARRLRLHANRHLRMQLRLSRQTKNVILEVDALKGLGQISCTQDDESLSLSGDFKTNNFFSQYSYLFFTLIYFSLHAQILMKNASRKERPCWSKQSPFAEAL